MSAVTAMSVVLVMSAVLAIFSYVGVKGGYSPPCGDALCWLECYRLGDRLVCSVTTSPCPFGGVAAEQCLLWSVCCVDFVDWLHCVHVGRSLYCAMVDVWFWFGLIR